METINVKHEVLEAEERIRGHIRETPIEHSAFLSSEGRCDIHLKLENIQLSGSFKIRGALNKYLSLSGEERSRGVVTASSGNHGAAFAHVLREFGGTGTVYLPENVSIAKKEALDSYGVNIELHGDDCLKAEKEARRNAGEKNLVFISPYNDRKIIGGQGTIAIELARGLEKIDTVLAPVGGGGLISGVAGYLKQVNEGIEIIGCQPKNSAVMYESIKAGTLLDMESKPTISDGTAGGIEQGSITFDLCRELVDDFILVSEDEIIQAIRLVLSKHHMLIEGGAAVAVAAFMKASGRFEGRHVVLIVTGARIGLDKLKEVL